MQYRNELVRVDLKDRWVFIRCIADGLEGRSPLQCREVLGEVVGGHEGQDVGLEAFEIVIVIDFDDRLLDGAAHPLGLAIGPWMIRLGRPMFDTVDDADPVEDARSENAVAGAVAVLRQVSEGHAVVGQHDVDLACQRLCAANNVQPMAAQQHKCRHPAGRMPVQV